MCLSSYGDIIADTQALVDSLNWFSFFHVCRGGNIVAHCLARRALDLHSDCLVWLEDVLVFLQSVIDSETSFY